MNNPRLNLKLGLIKELMNIYLKEIMKYIATSYIIRMSGKININSAICLKCLTLFAIKGDPFFVLSSILFKI